MFYEMFSIDALGFLIDAVDILMLRLANFLPRA